MNRCSSIVELTQSTGLDSVMWSHLQFKEMRLRFERSFANISLYCSQMGEVINVFRPDLRSLARGIIVILLSWLKHVNCSRGVSLNSTNFNKLDDVAVITRMDVLYIYINII